MRFLTKRNMKSWLSHWVAWLAGAPSLHVTRPYRIDISRNQTLKLLFCLSYFDFACSLNYTVHLLMKRCNMSFSCVVFFSFVCNSFFLFLFFFLNRYYQIYFVSSNEPVRNECEVIYEMLHILIFGFEIK